MPGFEAIAAQICNLTIDHNRMMQNVFIMRVVSGDKKFMTLSGGGKYL